MPAFITIGRVLFAVLFIVSGALKLYDLTATTKEIADKIAIPAVLATYTAQIETFTSMQMPQILAILAGAVELICGLMIALNIGVRFFAIVLVFFVGVATYYYHAFWTQTGAAATDNLIHALKNVSIIGALFLIAGYGPMTRTVEPAYEENI